MLYVISCTGGKLRVEDRANSELTGYEWKVLLTACVHSAMLPYSSLLHRLSRCVEESVLIDTTRVNSHRHDQG